MFDDIIAQARREQAKAGATKIIPSCQNGCGRPAAIAITIRLLKGKPGDTAERWVCIRCAGWLFNLGNEGE